MSAFRTETDSLGSREIPFAALYGIQTSRAIENFPISKTSIGQWPRFIEAFAIVKKSCAISNMRCGRLDAQICRAIVAACDLLIDGCHLDQFPIDVLQGGAGTSTNMNANEVIANLALQFLGYPPGNYQVVHPNDHVNMSQSTNDVYPTAARLSCLLLNIDLVDALRSLVASFEKKSKEFVSVSKLGRTQLQDAIPMTLGQEFSAFATVIDEDIAQMERISANFLEVSLGGTAIGTGLTAPEGYSEIAIEQLSHFSALPFRRASNLIEATWDLGAFVLYSGMLKRTATKLSKIANDLRLLSSGPRGGLAEIRLPERQPGSSIMPGKINPVIPEAMNQVAFAVIGNDITITLAAEAGQLQLNAMAPVVVLKLSESILWMTNAIRILDRLCVSGIEADEVECLRHLQAGTALVTALVPVIGYQAATQIAKTMLDKRVPLSEVLGPLQLPRI